jgi:outer membrane murein-binding lipoprotein Lpp
MLRAGLMIGSIALGVGAAALVSERHSPSELRAQPAFEIRPPEPVDAPTAAKPAAETPWVPSVPAKPGAVEETLLKVLPPAQSLQSSPPATSEQPIKSDLLLPADPPSINFKSSSSADRGAGAELPPIVVPPGDEPPPPVLIDLSAERELLPPPGDEVPETPTHHPGDATMTAPKFALAAVVGAALTFAPTATAADAKDDLSKTVEKLDALVKRLEAAEKSLTDYKMTNATAVSQVQNDVEGLKSRIRQIEDDVKALRQMGNPAVTSKFGPGTDIGNRLGRVRLTNEYLEEMSVVVNGVAYRLVPGQTRTVSVPAGTFTYQVLQLQPNVQTRTIAPDEEKPIRIYTQRY